MDTSQLAVAILAALVDEARDTGYLPLLAARVRAERECPGQGALSDADMGYLDMELDAITGIPAD